jgi:hypothetical protein
MRVAIPFDFKIRRILFPATTILAQSFHRIYTSSISSTHTSNNLDLRNTVGIPENSSDLRWCGTLPGELADLVNDLVGSDLEPCWRSARVGNGGSGDTLSVTVHATHDCGWREVCIDLGERSCVVSLG